MQPRQSFTPGRWMAAVRLLACVLAPTLAPGAVGASTSGAVAPSSLQAWKQFRAAQPFQTQVIAVSGAAGKGARTLIVTEPPPGVTWQQLSGLLTPHAAGCATQRWDVMAGGYVTDVVCTMAPMSPAAWAGQLERLQQALFGTSAAQAVVALPAPRRRMMARSLDLRFGPQDLLRWVRQPGQEFRTSPLGAPVTAAQLLARGNRGVFYTRDRALVVWLAGRGEAIDGAAADIRRFAVASDLVLGAIASGDTVAIVGRGRTEPASHLPPLRTETVLLLAGSDEQALQQSYERNDPMAGKGSDGIDRAPILLSPQLVDSEFGTLLNIADQLLKGWSMAGQVGYAGFAYPAPSSYPFGKTPAAYVEAGRDSFLFNFNTDGVAYRQRIGALDVLVPQRTGALSVIYGDIKDRPRKMEETAYDYFATSGDASLARVVQYTLLYQIFRQFDIRAAQPPVSPRHAQFAQNLQQMRVAEFNALLGGISQDELARRLRAYIKAAYDGLPDGHADKAKARQGSEEMVASLMGVVRVLRAAQFLSNGKVAPALATVAGALQRRGKAGEAERALVREAEVTLASYFKPAFTRKLVGRDGLLAQSGLLQISAEYLDAWNTLEVGSPAGAPWNHTAYVVQSRARGRAAAAVGGHNINAPLVAFVENKTLAAGTVTVETAADGSIKVNHSSGDQSRLADIARMVATRRAMDNGAIAADVAAELGAVAPRAPVELKQVHARLTAAAPFAPPPAAESGYRTRPLTAAEQSQLDVLGRDRVDAVVVVQAPDGSFILQRTGSAEVLQVATATAATDAIAHGLLRTAGGLEPVSVFIKGLPDAKAQALMGQIQSNLRRYDKTAVNTILNLGERAAMSSARPLLVNAKIAHNGIRVDRAAVKAVKVEEGEFKGYTRLEVPLTINAKTPLRWRLIFFIKDASAKAVEQLLAKVDALLARLTGAVSPASMTAAVRTQLAADLNALGIDTLFMKIDSDASENANDVILASRSEAHRDGA